MGKVQDGGEMMDREKVIRALENCTAEVKCRDCPWKECEDLDYPYREYPDGLVKEALALLKAQEPVVRCKDCSYFFDMSDMGGVLDICDYRSMRGPDGELEYINYTTPEAYCSMAIRREEDGAGS